MDPTEKRKLLVNIRDIKLDLYALKEYVDRVNTQKMGKPMTTQVVAPRARVQWGPTAEEEGEIQQLAGGKRKSSSKKRKSKKRKSKKRKSKTRRRR
jgi:hypothetical protein